MGKLIREMEVETVGELKAVLSVLPDDMEVSDAVGELLCIRIYEEDGKKFMEIQ
jgi:hypothetical protein